MAYKKGDTLKVKAVIPTGPVLALRMSEDGDISYLLEWVDLAGETQQRWFREDELEPVGA
jgi:uncharacterized protein YodC (DUF2158 family)